MEIAGDQRLEGYNFVETAYAVWHQGVYADVEKDIVDKNGNRIKSLKNFLKEEYSGRARASLLGSEV